MLLEVTGLVVLSFCLMGSMLPRMFAGWYRKLGDPTGKSLAELAPRLGYPTSKSPGYACWSGPMYILVLSLDEERCRQVLLSRFDPALGLDLPQIPPRETSLEDLTRQLLEAQEQLDEHELELLWERYVWALQLHEQSRLQERSGQIFTSWSDFRVVGGRLGLVYRKQPADALAFSPELVVRVNQLGAASVARELRKLMEATTE